MGLISLWSHFIVRLSFVFNVRCIHVPSNFLTASLTKALVNEETLEIFFFPPRFNLRFGPSLVAAWTLLRPNLWVFLSNSFGGNKPIIFLASRGRMRKEREREREREREKSFWEIESMIPRVLERTPAVSFVAGAPDKKFFLSWRAEWKGRLGTNRGRINGECVQYVCWLILLSFQEWMVQLKEI